jgi:APA family basic amino acid/polyamine antiporter
MSQDTLSRTISLPGAAFLIIGYVVGATIFILPGSLAVDAGPAVYIAYLLAAIPAVFACFAMALVGSAIPASGSIYLLIRDLLSPSMGFLYLWIMVAMAAVVIPLVAFGFADYSAHFHPGLNSRVVAMSVIALFITINYLGMKVASSLQNVMVVGFIIVLLLFSVGGLANGDPSLMKPLFPRGWSPIVLATITAYFSYAGVFIIAEVAGEIKNPGRTIPLAIFLSFIVIILLYTLVPLALTSVLSWETLGSTKMAVVTAAQQFLPGWVVTFIAAGALFAAATSINGIMMGLSRDFYKGAKFGLFPRYFGGVHSRFKTPGRAVLVIGALALAGAFAGGSVVQYAQIAVMGLMIIQIMTGIALLKLPGKMPEVYAASSFKPGALALRFISIAYIMFSVVFLIILGLDQPDAIFSGLIFMAMGFAWYLVSARRNRPVGNPGG